MFWLVRILGRGVFGGLRGKRGPLEGRWGDVGGRVVRNWKKCHHYAELLTFHLVKLLLELAVSCVHVRWKWRLLLSKLVLLQ